MWFDANALGVWFFIGAVFIVLLVAGLGVGVVLVAVSPWDNARSPRNPEETEPTTYNYILSPNSSRTGDFLCRSVGYPETGGARAGSWIRCLEGPEGPERRVWVEAQLLVSPVEVDALERF